MQVKHRRVRRILLIAALSILLLALSLGITLAKYVFAWEHGFGVRIYPKEQLVYVSGDAVSGSVDSVGLPIKHVIFAYTSSYPHVPTELAATKKSAGMTSSAPVYSYYDSATYTTYILSSKIIFLPTDASELFADNTELLSVTFENLETPMTTSLAAMFRGCEKLEVLNLSRFNTVKVTDMSSMFEGCTALHTVYAKASFVTSAITDASAMFEGCYALSGGRGTAVYPNGAGGVTNPLDASYARIDAPATPGYFTSTSAPIYASSNLLTADGSAAYSINGSSAAFTVANGLDSSIYSSQAVIYTLTYAAKTGDSTYVDYHTEAGVTLPGGSLSTEHHTLAPAVIDAITYNTVRVTVDFDDASLADLSATFTFTNTPMAYTTAYADGVITLTLRTNDQGGVYSFSYISGVSPDGSDPNGLFIDAPVGPVISTPISLNAQTLYVFRFFVTGADAYTGIEADPTVKDTYLTVAYGTE